MLTYSQRASYSLNPTAQRLFHLMDEKKTNLALAADVTRSEELLHLADLLGPELAILKTHIDIIEDFTPELTHKLRALSEKHHFLIFEDRKFADIGNTVKWQYRDGVYRIAEWSDITNAHTVPGPGIIEGLKEVGLERGRGLLLLAEMSSKGTLAKGKYTEQTVEWALAHADFVIGFITTRKLSDNPAFIHMTPGVQLTEKEGALGQSYLTPHQVIVENKSDLIIVGRGIYEAEDQLFETQKYRIAGWEAYQSIRSQKKTK